MTMREANMVAVDPAERSHLLDGLRGLALLGILIVNLVGFIGFGFLDDAGRAKTIGHAFDDISELLIEWLAVGKFYSIFSLLFGIGFAIQIGRLEARGEGVSRYLRRLTILFLIGLAHLLLLWFGDILALYALMGAVLLLFRKRSDRALLLWAVTFWLAPIAWSAMIHLGGVNPAQPIFQQGMETLRAFGIDPETDPLVYYRDTGFIDQLAVHPADLLFRIGDLTYQMRFTKVLAMFLIGLWAGRRAIHADPAAHRALLRKVAAIGLGAGLPLSFARASIDMMATETPLTRLLIETLYCVSTPTLALGYAAGGMLLWANGRRRLLEWAAPAGRMALTNYLMQSVLQGLIFYGWWLGLTGYFGLVFIFPFALAIFAFQVAFSRWWLARYRFGPVEWLWRSLTYGRAQAMRQTAA
jgi:uncharacterized protein